MNCTRAQTAHTFAAELKDIGIEVPPDTISIRVTAGGFSEPVSVIFESVSLGKDTVEKSGGTLKDKSGVDVLSQQLFSLLKETVIFPAEVTSFEIIATVNEVVYINITSAFPACALSPLEKLFK